jgi:alpha-1,2-mannosyltransferase
VTTTALAERLAHEARSRGWWLPLASATATVVAFTVIVWSRREVDLGTYLMGGAHAFSPDLYTLFSPVAHLPLRLNTVAFTWLGLVALFTLLAVTLRAVCPTLEQRAVVWWALALVGPAVLLAPVRETLLFGQINLLLALAVVADMTLNLRVGKGVLVGLAAAIKLTPIILVPYLFLTRRTRAGWTAMAAFAAFAAAAALFSPHASWTYWSHDAWFPSRAGSLSFVGNQGAVGVVERLLRHSLTTATTFAIVATVSGIGIIVATFAHRRSSLVLGLVVMEATESMASPVSWDHHYIWIILLIAWLALGADRPAHGPLWAATVAVVFWAAPIWWVPHDNVRYAGQGWLIPVANCFFLVMVVVVVAAAVRVVHRRPRGPGAARVSGTISTGHSSLPDMSGP